MEPTTTALTGAAMAAKANVLSFLAGLIGATISLKFVPGMSVWEKFITVLAGAAISHFTSRPVSDFLHMHDYYDSVCFLLGLFGLSLCAAIIHLIRELNVAAILYSKLGVENVPSHDEDQVKK